MAQPALPPAELELKRIEALSTRVAQSLINAMEAKNSFLRGHSERVAALAATIGASMGLDDDTIEDIRLAGRLHDVGKIGVSEAVLNKPGKLTEAEFAHVRDHVRIGLDILEPLSHLGPVLDYVRHHHERRDGSGYPHGLRGDEISLGGAIVGAADVFDALTSPRSFRDLMSRDDALRYLRGLKGPIICPLVFPALQRVVSEGRVLVFLDEAVR